MTSPKPDLPQPALPPSQITPALAQAVAAEGLMHLFRMLTPEGRFIYAHAEGDPEAVLPGYNMLRHCGTLWFMLSAVNALNLPLLKTESRALAAGISYAGARMKRPGWAPGLAIVTNGQIKLGGVGLALLMLSEYREARAQAKASPTRTLAKSSLPEALSATMAGLADYALSQERPGQVADFHHKRALTDGQDDGFHSDYYTGEALFGLIAGGADPARTAPLAEALMQRGYGIDVQSHWMAYAACAACDHSLVPDDLGRSYLGQLLTAITTDTAYRDRCESTPIACRSEALVRFLWLDRRHPGRFFAPAQLALIRETLTYNLGLQLRWFRRGQFRKGDTDSKVQIDYIQHNAMAFLAWAQLHA